MPKSNLWIFETHRPGMTIVDSLRTARVKLLKDAASTRTVGDHQDAQGMKVKSLAYASLDLEPEEKEDTIVARADDMGRFITDDPITAFLVDKECKALGPINHPLTKKAFTYAKDPISPEVPASLEAAVKLAEKAKKA